MKGLELSQAFYNAVVDELFRSLSYVRQHHAAGLVGEGSECFGYDDNYSQDHDWGPAFCIWLSREDFVDCGAELQKRYERLSQEGFWGYPPRSDAAAAIGARRVGVFPIDGFYAQLLRTAVLPQSYDDWRRIPETGLSAATNGAVFADNLGRFTQIRERLRAYYPEDIRLRKIASGCMQAAQAGQYNFPRQVNRGQDVAALQALALFIDAVQQITYALACTYRPFYKWARRGMEDLGTFGAQVGEQLDTLVTTYREDSSAATATCVEHICTAIVKELHVQGLSNSSDGFLVTQGVQVNSHIQDDAYRKTDLMSV